MGFKSRFADVVSGWVSEKFLKTLTSKWFHIKFFNDSSDVDCASSWDAFNFTIRPGRHDVKHRRPTVFIQLSRWLHIPVFWVINLIHLIKLWSISVVFGTNQIEIAEELKMIEHCWPSGSASETRGSCDFESWLHFWANPFQLCLNTHRRFSFLGKRF